MKAKTAPQVRDIMSAHTHTVSPDMPMSEVLQFLVHCSVTSVPVVEQDADGRSILVGVISEGDCLECLANEVFFGSPCPVQTVRNRMKRHPICVDPEMDLFTLASIFMSHQHRYFPVVEDRYLVGMVDRLTVIRALDAYYRDTMKLRDSEKSKPKLRDVISRYFVAKD